MRLWNLACGGLAVSILCGFSNAHAASKDLADSVKAVIEANETENWPADCLTYRAEVLDIESASSPRYVEPLDVNPQMAPFQFVDWNGIRIPIPDDQFGKVVLIPDGIAPVRSEGSSVLFSSLDMTPHFEDHFGEIDDFADYAASGRNIVGWIEEGLALTANDIQCEPESMVSDLVGIVHSLFATMIVIVHEETRLIRLNGSNPALLFGALMPGGESTRIQYIFQHPRSENIELLTLTYHLERSPDLVPLMSALFSAIENAEGQPDSDIAEVARAILDQDYAAASSIAKSLGLAVQTGLE